MPYLDADPSANEARIIFMELAKSGRYTDKNAITIEEVMEELEAIKAGLLKLYVEK